MDTVPMFHIFSGDNDRDAVWVCAVRGLADAKTRMDQLAAEKPGLYFVFLAGSHEILARTDTSNRVNVALHYPQIRIALEIIRKIGHTVGDFSVADGEPRVAIDGEQRSYDQVFQMIEDYNKRRTA